ncbi:MAG: hypothetical protein AB7H93_22880 [Vicinamibacterales bacterium]
MDSPVPDLQVSCLPSLVHDGDVAFVAERTAALLAGPWVLYVASDAVAIDIRRVAPSAQALAMHTSGALGLLFPASVLSVQLDVAPRGGTSERWRFWVDDAPDVTDLDADE